MAKAAIFHTGIETEGGIKAKALKDTPLADITVDSNGTFVKNNVDHNRFKEEIEVLKQEGKIPFLSERDDNTYITAKECNELIELALQSFYISLRDTFLLKNVMLSYPRIPAVILNQEDRNQCSGYATLAYLYNSYAPIDINYYENLLKTSGKTLFSMVGATNFFNQRGLNLKLTNISKEQALERIKNRQPVIVDIGFFKYNHTENIVDQDFSLIMGGHIVCWLTHHPERWEKVVRFQNSWGDFWNNAGYGYVDFDRGNYTYYKIDF